MARVVSSLRVSCCSDFVRMAPKSFGAQNLENARGSLLRSAKYASFTSGFTLHAAMVRDGIDKDASGPKIKYGVVRQWVAKYRTGENKMLSADDLQQRHGSQISHLSDVNSGSLLKKAFREK